MRIVNTHGALHFGTPLQEFARRREYQTGETVIQIYQYGAWVEICPGNEVAFRPMRIIPSYPNHDYQKPQNPQEIQTA
jgi:hypothetical protein